MVNSKFSVVRVTVEDGVDSSGSFQADTGGIAAIIGANLVPVFIGQGSVTYDIYVTHIQGGAPTTINFTVKSSIKSVGVEIINQQLVDVGDDNITGHTDVHTRDSTNNQVTTNLLIVHAST